MSSLNFSNINQSPGITALDLSKLVLISAARMETALSKLTTVLAEGLSFASEVSVFDKHFLHGILKMNKAVEEFLINSIKLQMLLQSRIDYIFRFLDSMPGIKKEANHAAGTQTAEFNMPYTLFSEYPVKSNSDCKYSLIGRAVGLVSNICDPFHNGIAIIQACINHIDKNTKDNFLCYSVHKGNAMRIFSAFASGVKIKFITEKEFNKAIVEGTGSIVHKERFKPDTMDTACFILTISYENNESKRSIFQFVIKPDKKPDLFHDSGEISIECPGLIIETAINKSITPFLGFIANEEFELANTVYAEAEKIQSVLEKLKENAESKYALPLEEFINISRNAGQTINKALKQEMNLGI